MDLRSMQDDEAVVVKDDSVPQSAWPPWKHLLEDLAEARPPPRYAVNSSGCIAVTGVISASLCIQYRVAVLTCTAIVSRYS